VEVEAVTGDGMKWNILLNRIYLIYFKWKNQRNGVVFAKGSRISSNDQFEGNNYIAGCILDSYVGYGSYISNGSYLKKAKIGRFCSIAPGVRMTAGQHPVDFVSTSPAFHLKRNAAGKSYVQEDLFNVKASRDGAGFSGGYDIIIGNDVWIGQDAMLFPGITVGDGAVIGARALVNKSVPPYSVCAGVPAKVLRYRFTEEQIGKLQEIKWWDKGEAWLYEHAASFSDIEQFLKDVT
jgi:acetyltransferase-like isoleucine patch superfamily enzyme